MLNITLFKKVLNSVLTVALILQVIGCGTLIYPERRGQTTGNIDPGIAILDGIGLVFFIVPGLVAFAIDFTTGAIYLPAKRNKSASKGSEGIRVVYTNPDDLSQQKVEEILAEQMGHSVYLNRDDLIVSELSRPQDFMEKYDKLVESGEIPE
jgi:hypothetical protein